MRRTVQSTALHRLTLERVVLTRRLIKARVSEARAWELNRALADRLAAAEVNIQRLERDLLAGRPLGWTPRPEAANEKQVLGATPAQPAQAEAAA